MSDLLERLHIDAALDLMRADAGLTVYPDPEGTVPLVPSPPYVRVYTSIERPADDLGNALAGLSSTWIVRWYVHCVGDTEYAAAAMAMRVRSAILDRRPVIAGRNCGLIRQEPGAGPPSRDESTGVSVFDGVVIYRLRTEPG